MGKLDPKKLYVVFQDGVTTTDPIIPRRYTLTHSDITADLFLDIGPDYANDKVTAMKDEVRGEWVENVGGYLYYVYLDVDGQTGWGRNGIRNFIFRRELPLALQAIRFGDREFFQMHPELNNAPIIVFFQSENPKYNSMENWGTFTEYDVSKAPNVKQLRIMNMNKVVIDSKLGDVNGDGVPDIVTLYGTRSEDRDSTYIMNLTIVIEDGRTKNLKTIIPQVTSGYNPTLFLGDFTKDKVDEIKLSMETGGSGGYGNFYIYSFFHNQLSQLFDSERYNNENLYKVNYENQYKVGVSNVQLDRLFTLDISGKGADYLSQYYNVNEELIKPVTGEVSALNALIPYVSNEKENYYELSAIQRIIGTYNADTLGYIQNQLGWNGRRFVTTRMLASVEGLKLIFPF